MNCQAGELEHELADLSRPQRAIELAKALGAAAVGPLERFLQGTPGSVPHARVLAVDCLKMEGGSGAIAALRAVLVRYPLDQLDPVVAQAEYVVKNRAAAHLVSIGLGEFAGDFEESFRRERLPASAEGLAKLRVTKAIPDLIDALEDDVAEPAARAALAELMPESAADLRRTLSDRHANGDGEARISRRRRIDAASLLAESHRVEAIPALREMAAESDPSVAGAAAAAIVTLEPKGDQRILLKALLRGALSPEWNVSLDCQAVVEALRESLGELALEALGWTYMPNLYGMPESVPNERREWLVGLVLESWHGQVERLLDAMSSLDPNVLVEGIRMAKRGNAVANVQALWVHPSNTVRQAVALKLPTLLS